MLSSLTGKPKRRKVTTYDLEWHSETCEVSLCGAYDESGYRAYRSVRDFLNGEFHGASTNRTFLAHWGGRFDVQQLIGPIREHGGGIDAALAGGSAVITKVSKGGDTWVLADSASIARTSLAELGESIGRFKPACDTDNAPWTELCDRNREDCAILYDWTEQTQDRLESLGGSLGLTAASTAMSLFRRRFLREDITTDKALNEALRPFYFASRIEPFVHTLGAGEYNRVDVNSSFPASMLGKLPGSLSDIESGRGRVNKRSYCLYVCSVNVPETLHIPPLPYKGEDGRIYFPTGNFSGIYTEDDVELAEELGCSLKVSKTYRFHLAQGFADYAATLFEIKRLAVNDPPLRELAKILLNSLYGKTAERTTKEALFIAEEGQEVPDGARVISPSYNGLPRVYGVEREAEVAHAHLPLAMAITSRSRALLTRLLVEARNPFYCDTDCVDSAHRFVEGDALGALKHELNFASARYIAPKLYMVKHREGETCQIRKTVVKDGFYRIEKGPCSGVHVKSKGFRRLSEEDFLRLADGGEITIERMTGLAESLELNPSPTWGVNGVRAPGPAQIKLVKSLSIQAWQCPACYEVTEGEKACGCRPPMVPISSNRPKREERADGSTRPWNVAETQLPWKILTGH